MNRRKSKHKEKLNIAMFGQKRIPSREGGVEIVVEELCTRMVAQGHNVTCYNRGGHHVSGSEYDSKRLKEYKGIKLKTVPTIEKKGLAAVSSSFFAALCCAFGKYDVVHIHAEGPAFFAWLPKMFGKKVIVTIHGLDWQREKWKGGFGSKFIHQGEKNAVKYADEIIVLSKGVQDYFEKTYGRKTVFIPNGVSNHIEREPQIIKNKFGLGKDEYILFLGRLVPEKGIKYLIEAFKQVDTEKKLVIAGGSSDTSEFENEMKELEDGKTVYLNSEDAKRFIPKEKNGCLFTVLADCSRYSVSNLDKCDGTSIDAVRECFFKGERSRAVENCKVIKDKGYKCFVQPVDILGYSDAELIDFLQEINNVEPYCLSIVDTFGSMYQDDLHRIFEIINHNLIPTCKVGFHSHNNMQMSNALSQEFIRMTYGKREIVVDGTISGMGRGAGNTPTELIAQYLVSQREYNYDIDAILDLIDDYMDNIRTKCSWGYSTPYFIAGCYGAHVNNIAYLTQKNSIRSKDIRYILNKIGAIPRKRYDYNLLEKTYVDYTSSEIDDSKTIKELYDELNGKDILILVPGSSVTSDYFNVQKYIEKKKPVIISVNFIHDKIDSDYVYMSNVRRYSLMIGNEKLQNCKKITTSNIKTKPDDNEMIISFNDLIKCGWNNLDNSTIMLLRLLDKFHLDSIALAGFDGYDVNIKSNYATNSLELSNVRDNPMELNEEIHSMLEDYKATRNSHTKIQFITPSRFSEIFDEGIQ